MGVAKYMKATWNRPKLGMSKEARRNRMSSWRKEGVFQRIERPTRIDAARRVGYRRNRGLSSCEPESGEAVSGKEKST